MTKYFRYFIVAVLSIVPLNLFAQQWIWSEIAEDESISEGVSFRTIFVLLLIFGVIYVVYKIFNKESDYKSSFPSHYEEDSRYLYDYDASNEDDMDTEEALLRAREILNHGNYDSLEDIVSELSCFAHNNSEDELEKDSSNNGDMDFEDDYSDLYNGK